MTSPLLPTGPEGGEPNLRRAVRELPTHEPDAASWDAIAAHLASEQALARTLPQLPTHEPAADTWDVVAHRLDQLAAPRPLWQPRQRRRWVAALSLAASLVLLLAAGLAWWGRITPPTPVAVATPALPALPALPPALAADPFDTEGKEFIDARCTLLPQVCQSGEFQALRAQLTVLRQQEERLRT